MNGTITTQHLSDILDEAETITIHDCGHIIAAATAVRAFGPMSDLEPPKWWKDERTADAERAAAERAFRAGRLAHIGTPDLPMGWSIDYHLDGAVMVNFLGLRLFHIVDPDASPRALLGALHARVTNEAASAAAVWRTQAADLISRAELSERLAAALFPATEV